MKSVFLLCLSVFCGAAAAKSPEELSSLVALQPRNEKDFSKRLVKEIDCDVPTHPCEVGLIEYSKDTPELVDGQKQKDLMKVTSRRQASAQKSDFHTKQLDKLDEFLDGKLKPPYNAKDFDLGLESFDVALDGYSYPLAELDGVKFAGADKTRAIIAETGQDEPGWVEVQIFARKGQDYVFLEGYPAIDYRRLNKTCEHEKDYPGCFVKKVLSEKETRKLIDEKAQYLTKLFAAK
jgi:hypothetical protein